MELIDFRKFIFLIVSTLFIHSYILCVSFLVLFIAFLQKQYIVSFALIKHGFGSDNLQQGAVY